MYSRRKQRKNGLKLYGLIVVLLLFLQLFIVTNGVHAGFEGDRNIITESGQFIQTEPAVASYGGNVYAVWSDYRNGYSGIYFSYSSDAGNTFLQNQKISDLQGGNQISPAIAVNDSGSISVVWEDISTGKIRIVGNGDVSKPWGFSSIIDSSAGANGQQKNPAIAADSSGVYVVWEDTRSENVVDLWDATGTSEDRVSLSSPVLKAKYSPDGAKVAIVQKGSDSIEIYTVSNGSTSVLSGHTAQVNDIAWSPDSSSLLSVGSDKKAIIWDVSSASALKTIDGYSVAGTCAWSPADNYIAVGFNGIAQGPSSPPRDVNISLYDTSGVFYGNLTGHSMPPSAISWAGNGTCLASSSTDTHLIIWNAASRTIVKNLQTFIPLYAVSYSPDSTMVATGGKGGYLRIVNATTGSLISNMPGHQGSLNAIGWASNSTYLVTGGSDCTSRLWRTDAMLKVFKSTQNRVNDVSFSPDDSHILIASGNLYGVPSIYVSHNSGSGFSSPVKVNDCNMGSRAPAIALGGQRVYVVWSDERSDGGDIYASYSDDGGLTFSPNIRVNTGSGKNQYNPDIATNSSGTAFVVWQDEINKTEKYDIFVSHSDNGSSWSSPVMINNGSASYYTSTSSQTPKIAITADDILHVVWADNRNGDMDIYYSSSANGDSWSDSVQVNDNSTMPQYSPDISAGYDNSTDIVWQDYRNGYLDPDIYADRSPENIAPSPPVGVHVSDPGLGRTLDVFWEANSEPDIGGYRIYRNITGSGSGGPYVLVGEVNSSSTHFSDRGVKDFVTYYYVVTAIDNQAVPNESPYSAEASGSSTDTTPPAVVQNRPMGDAVPVDTNITLDFDETVNTSTVMQTFSITWSGGSIAPSDGTFYWSNPPQSFIFDPAERLNYSTRYTVSIGPGVEDIYGNAMGEEYTWSFTTRPPLYIQPLFPDSAGMHDPITISADISSEQMIRHVFINYTDLSGEAHNTSMEHASGTDYSGRWEYTIASQDAVGSIYFRIWADDSGGNTALTKSCKINITDTEGPTIVHIPPYYAITGSDVWINATITDDSAVSYATVVWQNDGISHVDVMNSTGDGNYSTQIPAPPTPGTITYEIIAYDIYDNIGASRNYTLTVELPDESPPVIYPIDGASTTEEGAPHASYQENIPVHVRVSDDRHVLAVRLWYKGAGGNAYISSDMRLSNGSITDGFWSGYIPAQNTGGVVRYFIEVYDGNNTVTMPADATDSTYVYVVDAPAEPSVIMQNLGLITLQFLLLVIIIYLLVSGMMGRKSQEQESDFSEDNGAGVEMPDAAEDSNRADESMSSSEDNEMADQEGNA